MTYQLVWLKRDLRIRDHGPLVKASQRGQCIVLYVYEPELIESPEFDSSHLRFINESLKELESSLREIGGQITYRVGRLPDVFQRIHKSHPIDRVWAHQETGNRLTYDRDERVRKWTRNKNIEFREIPQTGVIRRLEDRDGWADRWDDRMSKSLYGTPDSVNVPDDLDHENRRSLDNFDLKDSEKVERQNGGETRARRVLKTFLYDRGERYRSEMSSPVTAWDSCSRLSPHLAWGTISIKQVHQLTRRRQNQLRTYRDRGVEIGSYWLNSLQSFQKRLRWHCHFMQKLEDEPRIEFENLATSYDGLREDDFDEHLHRAWCEGRTGFPMVDACMRALHESGWINFRMRAMLMSFSSYHLWNHWRKPALHLARHFLDFEPGIHFPQVQMQSGTTGINSIRIYNPTKQVHDHDPDGDFIRKYVPELEDVPKQYLAEPSGMPGYVQRNSGCIIGEDYPEPVVDAEEAYRSARDKIWTVKESEEAQKEADKIYEKHGSRRN
ncbi:MAG: deoxyribodipyrimidine photo-lyase/cryptochrome family protein [bacterium]